MKTILAFHNLLIFATRTRKTLKLYLCSSGSRIDSSIAVDDGHYEVVGYRLNQEERQSCQLSIEGWLAPFWRIMEADGWMVANKNRTGRGEIVWQLRHLETESRQGYPCQDELAGYVNKIRPLAGERAQRALEIAISGKVQHLKPDENGADCWQVSGSQGQSYIVSISGKSCTCPDAANGAPRWLDGPLCKHRLAVMYCKRWEEATGKQICSEEVDSQDQASVPVLATVPDEYVSIAPPAAGQGWRWVHVRGHGRLAICSTQEYPNQDTVLKAAISVAQCKAVPFYYRNSQATAPSYQVQTDQMATSPRYT
jgi:hypothetical protein